MKRKSNGQITHRTASKAARLETPKGKPLPRKKNESARLAAPSNLTGRFMQTETAKTQDDLEDDRLQEFCDLYNEIARTPDAERRFAEALAILKTLTTCEFCEPPRADDRREFVAAAPAPEPTTIACAGGLGADDDNLQDRVLSDEEAEEFAAQLFDGFFKYDPKNDVLAAAVMKIVGKFACEDDSDVRENSMHALQIALYAWTDDCARRINAFADAAGAKLGHAA